MDFPWIIHGAMDIPGYEAASLTMIFRNRIEKLKIWWPMDVSGLTWIFIDSLWWSVHFNGDPWITHGSNQIESSQVKSSQIKPNQQPALEATSGALGLCVRIEHLIWHSVARLEKERVDIS